MDRKALIIDDQVEICQLLEIILNMNNISSLCTGSLRETWEVLSAYHPSIIFIDQNLPDGLGFNEVPKLKQLFPAATIIAMTAQVSALQKIEVISSGANFILEKPFTIQHITQMVGCK